MWPVELGVLAFAHIFEMLLPRSEVLFLLDSADLVAAFRERRWHREQARYSGGWMPNEWRAMFKEHEQKDIRGTVRAFDENEHAEFIPLWMIGILETEETMLPAVAERHYPSSTTE
jgi:hypothetical protein